MENDYLDTIFNDVDKNIKLDSEQKNIVIDKNKNLLVIAGAGSGKTTVISAKAKYMVEKRNIKPEEILIISFTNEAVNNLKEQINKKFNLKIDICTFHKLGLKIINNKMYKIADNLENILLNYFLRDIYFTDNYLFYLEYYYIYICNMKLNNLKYNNFLVACLEDIAINNFLKMTNINYKYEIVNFNNVISKYTIFYNNKTIIIRLLKKYKKNNGKYIDLYIRSNFLNKLQKELEIFKFDYYKLKNDDKNFYHFLNLCYSFIQNYKVNYLTQDYFDFLENKYISDYRISLFLKIIKNSFIYYSNYNDQNMILDFNDMVNKSINVLNENYNFKYKYIIIDEFQDISVNRLRLLQIFSNNNVGIIAFGDDWQAIYGFAGSDINLFINFNNYFYNSKILYINHTYRNSQELINISGNYIMKNKIQFKKNLVSSKRIENPIKLIVYSTNDNMAKLLYQVIKNIYDLDKNKKILILSRYKFDIKEFIDDDYIKFKNNKVFCKDINTTIAYLTIHSSKGMTYDEVIILNLKNDVYGFPSKIICDKEISILKCEESFLYAEERRLFYVALTRTKNHNYIFVPHDNPSYFILELLNDNKNINNMNINLKKYVFCNNCGYSYLKRVKICPHCNKRIKTN